eukprot:Phypoly_transcript_01887.p1 GENE.Phypoly_transcript_01887~~Phypoly_transcript_01887.p1  ORF type:complete len:986 (+),score=281.06 Phypoly_transcript_01887:54-3011(+)
MNGDLLLKDAVLGEVYWLKFGDYPFWPTRRAKREEVKEIVLQQEKRNFILVYFFGSHEFCWVEPKNKIFRFKLAKSPPGGPAKFSVNEKDLRKNYDTALYEARAYHERGDTSSSGEEEEEGEEGDDEGDEGSEIEEVEEISDVDDGKVKKKKPVGNGKNQIASKRVTEDDSDFKRSSGENQNNRTSRDRKKSAQTARNKTHSHSLRATRSSKSRTNKDEELDVITVHDSNEVKKYDDPRGSESGIEEEDPPPRKSTRKKRKTDKNNTGEGSNAENNKKEEPREKKRKEETVAVEHFSSEAEKPNKKRRKPMLVRDDSNELVEEKPKEDKGEKGENGKKQPPPQFIDLNAPEIGREDAKKGEKKQKKGGKEEERERGVKRRASATALVSVPVPSQEDGTGEAEGEEIELKDREVKSEEEGEEDRKERTKSFMGERHSPPAASPTLHTSPPSSGIPVLNAREEDETYDSHEELTGAKDLPRSSPHRASPTLSTFGHDPTKNSNTTNTNSTSSKNSHSLNSTNSLNSTTSSISLNSDSNAKNNTKTNTKNNVTRKSITTRTIPSDDEADIRNDGKLFLKTEKEHKNVLQRTLSEGFPRQPKDSYKHHSYHEEEKGDIKEKEENRQLTPFSAHYQTYKDNVTALTPFSKSSPYYHNNQSHIFNPILHNHKLAQNDDTPLNSQYPPPYNKNNSFYNTNNSNNNNNNNIDYKNNEYKHEEHENYQFRTREKSEENEETEKTQKMYIPTQSYHNSTDSPANAQNGANAVFGANVAHKSSPQDYVVPDSQITNNHPTRHLNLENNDLISESNISTVEELDQSQVKNKTQIEYITPTMRVHHSPSQCQPVPPSQLATPSTASNFNFYSSPVFGVMDYYEQIKKRKKKENTSNNNNSAEKQIQDLVAELIAKDRSELEAALKTEIEQKYTPILDELKNENADLRVQIDKLNDELTVTRAEFAGLVKEFRTICTRNKQIGGLVKQLGEVMQSDIPP